LDIKSNRQTLKMTSGASAGKNDAALRVKALLMSRCDFQLKSPLKAVGTHHYVHLDGFHLLPADVTIKLVTAESLAHITRGDRYNVARFDNSHNRVALLSYPGFFEDAFPALHESWNVDLTPGRVSYRSFRDSLTPPILHRKELMLPEDHPRRAQFQALTQAAEAIGLFEDATRIGFREQWLRLVRDKGYQIVGLSGTANGQRHDAPGSQIDRATPRANAIARPE
jgi:DNA phosphorothioation-associated putative methyltransferase